MEEDEQTYSFCGSPEYMAPEVVSKKGYGYPVDFYTLGAFLFEIMVGLPPFYSKNQDEMLAAIQHGNLNIPDYLSANLKDLLKKLLTRDLNKRIHSFQEIYEHPWLKGVNWNAYYNKEVAAPI